MAWKSNFKLFFDSHNKSKLVMRFLLEMTWFLIFLQKKIFYVFRREEGRLRDQNISDEREPSIHAVSCTPPTRIKPTCPWPPVSWFNGQPLSSTDQAVAWFLLIFYLQFFSLILELSLAWNCLPHFSYAFNFKVEVASQKKLKVGTTTSFNILVIIYKILMIFPPIFGSFL